MNVREKWATAFMLSIWIGVIVNVVLSLGALFAPDWTLGLLGFDPAFPDIWVRFAALLLILLSLFYVPGGQNLDRYRANAWLAVFSRCAGVVFFVGCVVVLGFSQRFLLFAFIDLVFAVVQGFILLMATRRPRGPISPTESSTPRSGGSRLLIGVLAVAFIFGGTAMAAGWYKLYREVTFQHASPEERFLYGSIGVESNEGIPYWIWYVLPRVFPEHLPGPGGYASLGFPWEEGAETPVGFSKKTIGFPRIGPTCAMCHTATYRTSPDAERQIVPGGPSSVVDPQRYLRFLFDCANNPRFTADVLMPQINYATKLSAADKLLYRYAIIPQTRKALRELEGRYEWMERNPDWGPGRIDPFNPVKFRMLNRPIDETIGNSDMMPIWGLDDRDGHDLHWDGMNDSVTEIVLAGSLGDGTSRAALPVEDLKRLEDWLRTVRPPAYPFSVDEDQADSGEAVFQQHCARCHAPGGEKTESIILLGDEADDKIATDPHRTEMWDQPSADAYHRFTYGYDWKFERFKDVDGYISPRLDGIWLRGPYLHNGSVPTLWHLLNPDQRPETFYRGNDVLDSQQVGFVHDQPKLDGRQLFLYDTRQPGNSNQGHTFGAALSESDKWDLIEYLKTVSE